MPPEKPTKWSGIATMLGGVLWAMIWYMRLFVDLSDRAARRFHEGKYEWLLSIPCILFMAGLFAFHARQANRTGQSGKAGFVLSLVALALMAVGVVFESGLLLLGVLALILGLTAFGIATMRAKVWPSWSRPLPLLVALILLLAPVLLFLVGRGTGAREVELTLSSLFGLAWILLGYALWSDKTGQQVT